MVFSGQEKTHSSNLSSNNDKDFVLDHFLKLREESKAEQREFRRVSHRLQRNNTFKSMRGASDKDSRRPSLHQRPPQEIYELILDRERFNLQLLAAMIVVGDAEQCLALIAKYFNEDLDL